jgi:hypothetical protein
VSLDARQKREHQARYNEQKRVTAAVNALEDDEAAAGDALTEMRALAAKRGWSVAELRTGWCLHMPRGRTVHRHSLGALKIFIETVK